MSSRLERKQKKYEMVSIFFFFCSMRGGCHTCMPLPVLLRAGCVRWGRGGKNTDDEWSAVMRIALELKLELELDFCFFFVFGIGGVFFVFCVCVCAEDRGDTRAICYSYMVGTSTYMYVLYST